MAAVMHTVETTRRREGVLPGTVVAPRPRPVASRRSNRSVATFWRRRIVAVGIVIGTVVMAAHAGAALGGSPLTTSGPRPHLVTHVVMPGDTLWTIAVKHYAGDPRDAIYRIDRRNHLGQSVIVPGQRLVLPSAH